jgi:hypothetical protein
MELNDMLGDIDPKIDIQPLPSTEKPLPLLEKPTDRKGSNKRKRGRPKGTKDAVKRYSMSDLKKDLVTDMDKMLDRYHGSIMEFLTTPSMKPLGLDKLEPGTNNPLPPAEQDTNSMSESERFRANAAEFNRLGMYDGMKQNVGGLKFI